MRRRAAPGWGGAPIRRPGARPRAADERQGSQGSYGVGTIWAMPGRLVAPGPGRSATMFTVPLLVMGIQKTVASTAACGMPSVRLPAGEPVSLMHRVADLPKAPACVWPEQNTPVAMVLLALPVVRGFRSTLSAPLKSPLPSSGGQSALVLLVAGLAVVALVEQAMPAFGPAVQVPLQGGVPQPHCGQ